MKSAAVIINPIAGAKRGRLTPEAAAALFAAQGIETEIIVTHLHGGEVLALALHLAHERAAHRHVLGQRGRRGEGERARHLHELQHARATLALESRAAGLEPPIDSPFFHVGARFEGARMVGTRIRSSSLVGAVFDDASAMYSSIVDSNAKGARFHRVFSRGLDVSGTNLTGAVFSDAVLHDARFSGADLAGADFTRAELLGAMPTDASSVDNARFEEVTDLMPQELAAPRVLVSLVELAALFWPRGHGTPVSAAQGEAGGPLTVGVRCPAC